jgi:hypothetical protein
MESKYTNKSLAGASAKALDGVEYDTKTRSVRIRPTKMATTDNNTQVNKLFRELLSKKSINILTAGDDQPVSDGSNHSPFTQAFLDVLESDKNKQGYIRFTTLADYIKKYVENKTQKQQKPQYKNESSENGDFVFKL